MANQDVVCADGEINSRSREILQFIESLVEQIDKYNEILGLTQMEGLKDELIRGKMYNISELLKSYKKELMAVSESFEKSINKYLSNIKTNDKFVFPNDEAKSIDSVISMFR